MAEAKTTQNERERDRIADVGYEAEHIAKTIGITRHSAFRLIKRFGKDREALMREATAAIKKPMRRRPLQPAGKPTTMAG